MDYDAWAEGIRHVRSDCGDGLSRVIDFKVNDVAVGEPGSDGKLSTPALTQPGEVNVTFDMASGLENA